LFFFPPAEPVMFVMAGVSSMAIVAPDPPGADA
jgi:hypothetical protein